MDTNSLKAARQGLPLGSMVSPHIAGALLGRMLPGDMAKLSHVDDVALGVRSQRQSAIIEEALQTRLAGLCAGPLKLKYIRHFDAADHLEFMHLRLRPDAFNHTTIRLSPSLKAFRRLKAEVRRRHAAGADVESLIAYAHRWAQGVGWTVESTAPHRDQIETLLPVNVYEALVWL